MSQNIDPVDPMDPVDPIDPIDPIDPVDSMEPTDPADPVDPDPNEPLDPVEPADPVDPTPPKSDHVPLNKYMAEKKRRQELEKAFAQQAVEREKLTLKQELINRGWPEYEAELQATDKVRQKQESDEVKSKLLDFEVKDLSKSDPFFADAESYKDEIKDKMREFRCSAEDAYELLRGKTRRREFQLEQEQRAAAKRRQTTTKKVENAAPSATKSPYKLDDHDKKALAGLQKAQPDSGWTAEKYWKALKQTE